MFDVSSQATYYVPLLCGLTGHRDDGCHDQCACCVPYAYFIPYAYGMYRMRIRIWYDRTRMVWLFVPYEYTYTITVYMQHIAIASAVLLFMNYTYGAAFCSDVLRGLICDKLVISGWTIHIWPASKVTLNRLQ